MVSFINSFLPFLVPILIVVALWTTVLKGFALWHAARGSQKWWFVALLLLNTIGILEIVYLVWFRPKTSASSTPAVSSPTES